MMRHAPNIIASFESGCFRNGVDRNTPIPPDLSKFVTFLESRPPLKSLGLTLRGRAWDSHAFQKLFFNIKVKGRVTIEVKDLQGINLRERPHTLSPEELSKEDKEFRILTKNLESTMLSVLLLHYHQPRHRRYYVFHVSCETKSTTLSWFTRMEYTHHAQNATIICTKITTHHIQTTSA